MEEIKLGVQLYTLREQCKTPEGFEETLKLLQSIGCDVIQISGIGNFDIEIKAELVEKYGMDVCVTHISFDQMLENFDTVVKEHGMLRCENIGIGSMPFIYRQSEEGIDGFIAQANEISGKLREAGFHFGYHNHAFEFEVHGGKRTMDRLIDETADAGLTFIPDTYWLQYAGVNPADYLLKMKGRVDVCHFKDMRVVEGQPRFAEAGTGNLDLGACYRACKEIGAGYIVIEEDNCYDLHPYEAVKIGFEGLRRIARENL